MPSYTAHFIHKARSYYTAIALQCQYIDYISTPSHRSITAFQVIMNVTSCDTAECSNIACDVTTFSGVA